MPLFIDYAGKKIGRFTFLKFEKRIKKTLWVAECECGNIETMRAENISKMTKKGILFECKKCKKDRKNPILIGHRYGRWTVIGKSESIDNHHTCVHVKCLCGIEKIVLWTSLNRKQSQSCGCFARKLQSKWVNTTQYPPSHGFKSKKAKKNEKDLYHLRNRIVAMCYNKENIFYKERGDKGYTVCDLWRNGAKDFYTWAINKGYKRGMVFCIRTDCKEYNPQNCYFLSMREFFRNKNSIFIEYNDKKMNLGEWAKERNITITALSQRIKKYGIEEALSLSWSRHFNRKYGTEHFESEIVKMYSEEFTFKEITEKIGCQISTIYRFLKKNNISPRPAKTRSSVEFDLKKEEIIKMIEKEGYSKVSKYLKISRSTLDYHVKKWNSKQLSGKETHLL
jgi:predicted DNA-binding transcriptional regulator AlpA